MGNDNAPNDASRKSKAEGDRFDSDGEDGAQGAGITNRSADEEIENQEAVPERGRTKPGAHAGHGDRDGSLRGRDR
jgi:hypothetical protein